MTRTEYKKARRLVRDNGLYALRWLATDHAAVMFKVVRGKGDALALRQRVAMDKSPMRINAHPVRIVPSR